MNKWEIDKIKRDKAIKVDIDESVKLLFDQINIMGNSELVQKSLLDAISRQHRALQGDFWNIMFKTIQSTANLKDYEYDGRNELQVRVCKNLSETLNRGSA